MADIYVRSTDGSDADNGTTWALAKATISGAAAIDAAGDFIYLSQAHNESTGAGTLILAFAGTAASPTRIIAGNDAAEPPTATATATVTRTGTSSILIRGNLYCYGVNWIGGSGAGGGGVVCGESDNRQVYESCTFQVGSTNTTAVITGASGTANFIEWRNCSVKFADAGQSVRVNLARFHWNGGGAVSGTTSPTVLLTYAAGNAPNILIESVDFSNFGSGLKLSNAPEINGQVIIRNCKLPASWSGTLLNTAFSKPGRVEMWNCDDGDTNYSVWIEDYFGVIRDEITIVMSGGAAQDSVPISLKMVSSANTHYALGTLTSPEIIKRITSVGSAVTLTIECIWDSATNATDKDIWVEAEYLGTSGFPLSTLITDSVADRLGATAATDQTTSSVTWTTTGMTNPNKFKLTVTFTPQEKGFVHARVRVGKTSATFYVNPQLTIA